MIASMSATGGDPLRDLFRLIDSLTVSGLICMSIFMLFIQMVIEYKSVKKYAKTIWYIITNVTERFCKTLCKELKDCFQENQNVVAVLICILILIVSCSAYPILIVSSIYRYYITCKQNPLKYAVINQLDYTQFLTEENLDSDVEDKSVFTLAFEHKQSEEYFNSFIRKTFELDPHVLEKMFCWDKFIENLELTVAVLKALATESDIDRLVYEVLRWSKDENAKEIISVLKDMDFDPKYSYVSYISFNKQIQDYLFSHYNKKNRWNFITLLLFIWDKI